MRRRRYAKKSIRGTLAANPLRGGVAPLLALQARSSRGLYRFPTQLPSGVLYAPKGAAAPLFFTRVCVCVYRVRVHQPQHSSEHSSEHSSVSPRFVVGVCLKHAPSGARRLSCSNFCVWFCGGAPLSARLPSSEKNARRVLSPKRPLCGLKAVRYVL